MTAELAPRKFSLFDHEAELFTLTDELLGYAERGEDPPAELLDAIAGGITATVEKRDRVGAFIRFCESQPKQIDAEIKRLQVRKKTIERGVENLYAYVKHVMDQTDQKVLEGAVSTFKITKNPPHVEVSDINLLPAEMVRLDVSFTMSRAEYNKIAHELADLVEQVDIAPSPDKKGIAARLKKKEPVPGASLKQTEKLEIK